MNKQQLNLTKQSNTTNHKSVLAFVSDSGNWQQLSNNNTTGETSGRGSPANLTHFHLAIISSC